MTARGTGAWDLPHLDTDRCPVRFTRGLFSAGDATLAGLVERGPGAAALAFVDEGVAAGRPELLEELSARGMRLLVVPGGHAIRHGASAVADMTAAVDALPPDGGGCVVAVGGASMLESLDHALAASEREVRRVCVPTTLHGLVAALDIGVLGRAHAVLCDFELLRSLSDRDWRGGIAPAIESALSQDRAFFWWLERQAEELWHRSLPAMAWVVYRTAQLRLSGPSERLGMPVRAGGARRGDAAAVGIALGVTCSHRAEGLPYLEWWRAIELLERLDLPVCDPRIVTPPGEIRCGLLARIGKGVRAERLDAASVRAAADVLGERAQRTRSRRSASPRRGPSLEPPMIRDS